MPRPRKYPLIVHCQGREIPVREVAPGIYHSKKLEYEAQLVEGRLVCAFPRQQPKAAVGAPADTELASWLDHFRQQLGQEYVADSGLTRWEAHDWPAIGRRAGRKALASKLRRWWNQELHPQNGQPIKISREDYFALCRFLPWYQPPTADAFIL